MIYTEQQGIISCQVLANKLIQDLIDGGMSLVYPSIMTATTYVATLKTSATTDIVSTSDAQRWYIRIESISTTKLRIITGTSLQLTVNGAYATNPDNTIVGHIGTGNNIGNYVDFIDRSEYTQQHISNTPMNYALTCSMQGIALGVWEEGTDASSPPISSFLVIQRPVNNRTGAIRTTGKVPVYCLYGINRTGLTITNKFVVRESDILRPTTSIDATTDSSDNCRTINVNQMVAITEENNYVVFFPNNLNTARYAYPQDDLDLIAYTSADVIAQGAVSLFKVYGEATCRSYKGLIANGANNTNMRILILTT